jgi:hypothetical protein
MRGLLKFKLSKMQISNLTKARWSGYKPTEACLLHRAFLFLEHLMSKICSDSMYPVYFLGGPNGIEVELSEEDAQEFDKVTELFNEWQTFIEMKVALAQRWPSVVRMCSCSIHGTSECPVHKPSLRPTKIF